MAWPISLNVGLKEWATVCSAMESGRQIVLLRKGGVYEAAAGFEVENREFLLFPTYLHQNAGMLKPEAQDGLDVRNAEPERVPLSMAGVVSDIVQLHSRQQMQAIDDEHIWSPPLIEMRFNYRPENRLYLLLVRGYRLHAPITIDNTPAYAGCKSWVPLEGAVQTGNTIAVLDDVKYELRRQSILDRIRAAQ